MKQTTRQAVSPLIGGIAGTVLQRIIAGKLARRGGGIKGMLLGAAATYLMNKYMTGRPAPVRRHVNHHRSHPSHHH